MTINPDLNPATVATAGNRRSQTNVARSDRHSIERSVDAGLCQSIADRRDNCGRRGDTRRLANTFGPERRERIWLFDQRGDNRWHVEEGRQQIIGEVAVADHAVNLNDLFHHCHAEALGNTAFDLAHDRQRIECDPDVLGRGDLDDLDQAQLRVNVDHGTVGDERERGVTVALAVLVDLAGLGMAIDGGLVE